MRTLCPLFFVLLLMAAARPAQAQSADIPRHGSSVTGLNDPEPADPRYVKASDLAKLKEQVQTLQDAYGQMQQEQRQQARRLSELEQTAPPVGPLPPARTLPSSSMSLRKP